VSAFLTDSVFLISFFLAFLLYFGVEGVSVLTFFTDAVADDFSFYSVDFASDFSSAFFSRFFSLLTFSPITAVIISRSLRHSPTFKDGEIEKLMEEWLRLNDTHCFCWPTGNFSINSLID
jgi:hypothetical protein